MTLTKHFALLLTMSAAFTIASSVPAGAQIVYPYPPYAVWSDSSMHIEVKPRDAEVYVDGYYAGIVDDYDGTFQRLRVEPGPHEVAIYKEGLRTIQQHVYLAPNSTFTMKQRMEPLSPGEVAVRPVPTPPPAGAAGPEAPRPLPRSGQRTPPPNEPPSNYPPPNERREGEPPPSAQRGNGTLTLQLQPPDAEVLIDGQPWPATQDRVVVDLPEGRHVVQVRKAGYVGYLTEVEVRRGETMTLNVNLRQQQ